MIALKLLLVVLPVQSYTLEASVTPVQKVIQLMQEMMAKGKQEKHEETVRFTAYKQFCQDTSADKTNRIDDANTEIESLTAAIAGAQSDATNLGQEIAELTEDVGGWTEDKANAKKIREKENADFIVTQTDYSESIDALERAIKVLKDQSYDRKQAASLLQKVAILARIPESSRRTITAFLQSGSKMHQDPLSVSAPEANAYEFQSGGVVDMLEKLLDKFGEEITQLRKEEMSAKHAYELMSQDLADSIKTGNEQIAKKSKTKAQREQDEADATGDLTRTTSDRDEDAAYLKSLTAQCEQKSSDFEARQELRAEELEAIEKAISIIASDKVSGSADKHLPGLLQKSLSQFLASEQSPLQRNVAAFLEGKASKLGSRVLSLMATKVADDPFVKVKKMIKDMITRLLEEANEEAEHKGWCDTEMATSKKTREHKSATIATLSATSDKLSADISKLTEEIGDLTDAINEINSAVQKATKVRGDEKKTNLATIEDAKDAQAAVAQAMNVLKEFYAKAAMATALVQQSPEIDAPETFDKPYTGMSDTSGGIVGMLEVINSDFARLEAETDAAETEAAKEYDRFMAESSKDKAVKTADMDFKTNTKTEKESDLNDTKRDLAATNRELEAALHYYEKLKPSCVDASVSYDERVGRREEEIESLKEALRILSGDDIA